MTIGADHRGKGYAAEAAVLLLRFMFAEEFARPHSMSEMRAGRGSRRAEPEA
ncbi:hypothetical protein [Streptomyces sp. C36]|uniref:hypothetical protein n=1 Tax=Streptomyces sp. C36 TaxID=3237122 RepID=UPI0034C5D0BE